MRYPQCAPQASTQHNSGRPAFVKGPAFLDPRLFFLHSWKCATHLIPPQRGCQPRYVKPCVCASSSWAYCLFKATLLLLTLHISPWRITHSIVGNLHMCHTTFWQYSWLPSRIALNNHDATALQFLACYFTTQLASQIAHKCNPQGDAALEAEQHTADLSELVPEAPPCHMNLSS